MQSNFKSKDNNLFVGLYVIGTIIFLIALGPYLKRQNLVTSILIPSLTLLAFFYDIKTFYKNNTEFILLLLIFISSLFSVFYYVNYEALINGFNGMLGAVLAAYIPVALNKNGDYSKYFHIGYVISILLLIAIMYYEGNFNFSNFASKVDYRDRFLLNANAYSYFSFFANFSLIYLYQKYKSTLWMILLISLPLLFIIISFATQSRSGIFIIIIINLCYWFFINKINPSNKLKKIFRGILIFSIFIFIGIQFIKIYENSRIKNRIEVTGTKVDSREVLIYESLKVFGNNPFLGVGLGQLIYHNGIGQFSHNSYVEILAEQGIFGGILLLFLFGIPLIKCWRLIMLNPNDKVLKINLLFFICFYLFNNIYPFYKFTFSMMYFFMIISIQNKLEIHKSK
ncbi:hypothetical protein SB49_02415 [Sediminicola sp. YIK13]|uniref:O-antigen ligase family protein n=1 Tax=Sediminicola sp. YIK13 TaxID=1453352 RepID=UPI00071ED822|nr:O-antigen ligase family protein [Sediminicola sp. YIK13]ALM06784.1 hypothetical protein SB49_02415 [Sediminicola sp. YIK13]